MRPIGEVIDERSRDEIGRQRRVIALPCTAKWCAVHQHIPRSRRRRPCAGRRVEFPRKLLRLLRPARIHRDEHAARSQCDHDGACRSAGPEHRGTSVPYTRTEYRIEWREKAVHVGIRRLPAGPVSTQCVGSPHHLRHSIRGRCCSERIELERNRDARPRDAHRRSKRQKVVEVTRPQRHVDGIDAGLFERRVVHDGRERMHRVRAHDAIDGGLGTDAKEMKVVGHHRGRNLTGGDTMPRIRPLRTEVGCQQAGRHTSLAHTDHNGVSNSADGLQRQRLGQTRYGNGDLDRAGPHAPHRTNAVLEIPRHTIEVVR